MPPRPGTTAPIREFKESTRHKLPPITSPVRNAIRRWLDKEIQFTQKAAAEIGLLMLRQPTDSLKGQHTYYKHRLSVLKDLRARNEQRRGYGNVHRTGGTGVQSGNGDRVSPESSP